MSADRRIEDLLRDVAQQVLGALVRRHGQFDACEDAVQEALLAGTGAPGRARLLLGLGVRLIAAALSVEEPRRRVAICPCR
ncbi:hypothetical protein BL253_28415 [Pseudofrankia asymbiotica]|uniref:RNA polymerase sigma-70 region 2 domain-containing protein n=1 Tax=Pseudofrankia asymbiotica TaxID=1834516 RepID=A0A1V2I421_9ACTN|nr:hypothetical protein [Pseudofrankia asymbiotica]ONH25110.1 hypothetical protein BL253_28415 [Pseudofrankia asymbiotica]